MADEWPIAAPQPENAAEPARPAGRDRLRTVMVDFFLDPDQRLTEQERALMTGMLADLIGAIADEIMAGLPGGPAAANDEDGHSLMKAMSAAGLLDRPPLIALLLRRADDERIGTALRARAPASRIFLQALIGGQDEQVSAGAMDLILARGRRRDPLGQLKADFDDVPAEIAAELAYGVAGALRHRLPSAPTGSATDRDLSDSAARLLARHDEGRSIEALTAALVRALAAARRLDDSLLSAAVEEGDASFLSEALAQRAGIEGLAAWNLLVAGGDGRLALLLKMAGVSRDTAANVLAQLGDLLGIADPAIEIERFDRFDLQDVWKEQEQLRLDPAYRTAVAAMGSANG